MFDFFFQDYKDNVYKTPLRVSLKRLKTWEKLLLAAMILLPIIGLLIHFIFLMTMLMLILLLVALILIIFFHFHVQSFYRRERTSRLERHKERLSELKTLLKNKDYNLYNEQGIDWLITCTKAKKSGSERLLASAKNFFQIIIIPILTLAFGIYISEASKEHIILYSSFFIITILFFSIVSRNILGLYKILFENDKEIRKYLHNDLTYIRTQLSKK